IKAMEEHHWDRCEDWYGDTGLARVLTPYIKKLIQDGYTWRRPRDDTRRNAARHSVHRSLQQIVSRIADAPRVLRDAHACAHGVDGIVPSSVPITKALIPDATF